MVWTPYKEGCLGSSHYSSLMHLKDKDAGTDPGPTREFLGASHFSILVSFPHILAPPTLGKDARMRSEKRRERNQSKSNGT